MGRILSRRWETTRLDRVKDLARYPELRWLDHWHVVPVAAYAVAWWAIAGIPGVLFTFGEGWHHNHHHCPSTANQGWFWWEIDLSWYVLLLLAKLGVVWDLRTPPRAIRDGGRVAALD